MHVWAGISLRGPTKICVFEGNMDAVLYVEILRTTLLPFITQKFASGHRFMQDNDPKHTSGLATSFFEANNVNWWKTAPESPDLNPLENMWHELKEYIRGVVKPHSKEELVEGILEFWKTVDVGKCTRYVFAVPYVHDLLYMCSLMFLMLYLYVSVGTSVI